MEVERADELSYSGSITTDIVTRIMHSTYVVADVTYPNPNVFYELGLRHACKPGTIIIKDKNGPTVPFDIAHLRYIEYENTPTGLKTLTEKLKSYFSIHGKNLERPDNHFLELAKLTQYKYPKYSMESEKPKEIEAIMAFMQSPELMQLVMRQKAGEAVDQQEMMMTLANNPKAAELFLTMMVESGEFSFNTNQNRADRRRKK